ncbi:chitin elicitor receptor kinase 1-like [Dorcoceras hygrometricum]|uniref:Chitin elicitor receptor kinase 1-like n=1 Tax=Dorcoceras hygrometricum TaxID=472368 RepID=A0A2Z7DG35_9LAMI|nr:chitin elicitor receptor kinase 1-like [Dorcoceras hygrometricum]
MCAAGMPILEADRVTPVSLISLLRSVSHYERMGSSTPHKLGNNRLSYVLHLVTMVSPLVVELIQLVVPREMPPSRRVRGRGQFHEESESHNEEVQLSVPRLGHDRQVEIEVDELAARVDDMELVLQVYVGINNKGKAQNQEELLPRSSKLMDEQSDQISQESSNEKQLCASSSIRTTASNKVAIEKGTLKEPRAT